MSNVMTISKRTASGLEEVLRTLLLDAESKVPADRLRIVGALSDGAIIEGGSNANGEWVRWEDGTQVCTMRNAVTPEQSAAQGGTFTFPAVFISTPKLCVTEQGIISTSNVATVTIEAVPFISSFCVKIQLLKNGGSLEPVTNNRSFCAIAIGRWK